MNRPLLLSALALKHGSERTCARCSEPLMSEEDWPDGLCTWCHDDAVSEAKVQTLLGRFTRGVAPTGPTKQVILHVAGERGSLTQDQKCTRCKAIIARRGLTGWKPGRLIASFGHGDWSVVEGPGALDTLHLYGNKILTRDAYRPCKAKGREAIELEKWEAMGGKA